jgi:glycine/D-amino acid oxidase-like deaminating enzyme
MFTQDFKQQPYWWDRSAPPTEQDTELPKKVDVLIIGAGYTGLHAAIQTARGSRNTLVIDAEHAGWGCSTRNGGQVSTSIKPSFSELEKTYGKKMAFAIYSEGDQSLQFTGDFIRDEKLDCSYAEVGCFHAAHNTAQYEKLARAIEHQGSVLNDDAYMIPRSEQRSELGTDTYFGGIIFPKHASIDPAAYHKGLLGKALEAGANIISNCPAENINRDKDGFTVKTSKGIVQADKVIIATNGYTGSLTPRLQRRVIPIGSYVIATEPVGKDLMDQLMPKNRIVSDTRKVVYYYRSSPDRSRIIFGGRVSLGESDPRLSGPKLHNSLSKIFPELENTKISHSWMGYVAFTFDSLMHVGEEDGLFYAMGYCGSGVGMAGYLGKKLGQQVLGLQEGKTPFNDIKFQTRPLYTGKPWFLAPSLMYYRFIDSLNI